LAFAQTNYSEIHSVLLFSHFDNCLGVASWYKSAHKKTLAKWEGLIFPLGCLNGRIGFRLPPCPGGQVGTGK
jgi:hypothetical protein